MALRSFTGRLGRPSGVFDELATRVAACFDRFWNARDGWCFDVLDGPDGDDATLRPNQLIAVSLPASPLPLERRRAVVDACAHHLLTSYGLRTLARSTPATSHTTRATVAPATLRITRAPCGAGSSGRLPWRASTCTATRRAHASISCRSPTISRTTALGRSRRYSTAASRSCREAASLRREASRNAARAAGVRRGAPAASLTRATPRSRAAPSRSRGSSVAGPCSADRDPRPRPSRRTVADG